MKRLLIGILILALTLAPAWALSEAAESAGQDAQLADDSAQDDAFEEEGDIFSPESWVLPEGGGLDWDDDSMTIALPEDAASGYAWTADLDDETVLQMLSDEVVTSEDGALPLHTYAYQPSADGVALVSLFYEQQAGEDVGAMLSYTATVEGGKIVDVEYENLSDWDDEGDEAGGVLYESETGGVPLYMAEDMGVVSEENGVTRLESEDKAVWMTVRYDAAADWGALIQGFEDENALAKQYTDQEKGMSFLSTAVDRESDPPRGILVYEIDKDGQDTIVEQTVYEAPNGGALIVETGYSMQ